jgi:hypothetical protein
VPAERECVCLSLVACRFRVGVSLSECVGGRVFLPARFCVCECVCVLCVCAGARVCIPHSSPCSILCVCVCESESVLVACLVSCRFRVGVSLSECVGGRVFLPARFCVCVCVCVCVLCVCARARVCALTGRLLLVIVRFIVASV